MRNQNNSKYLLMGNYLNTERRFVDCQFHKLPFTNHTDPPCRAWDETEPKNFDYYFKRSATHISRKNYRWYQRGYIFGYYNVNYKYGSTEEEEKYKAKNLQAQIERAF